MTPRHARLRRGFGLLALVLATGAVGCASSTSPRSTVGPRYANPGYAPRMAPAAPVAPPTHGPSGGRYHAAPAGAEAPLPPPVAMPDIASALRQLPGIVIPPPYTERTAPITPYNPEPSPTAALIAANDTRVTMARAHARDRQIRLDVWHDRFVSNTEGYGATVVALGDGGAILVGTRRGMTTSVVVRLHADGRTRWERGLDGGYSSEGNTVLATNGGFLVHIKSFPVPGRAPFHRFVQLDPDGATVWERRLRGNGGPHTPHPQHMRENLRGTYDLKGHIYEPGAPETPWAWDGELDRAGRLLRDETGDFDPYMLPSQPADPGVFL